MAELATVSIGIGLVVSFVFAEFFSIAPGGMVVPGYLALSMHEPIRLLMTLGIALSTWMFVASLGQYIIIYGRRRTVLMILVGFLINALIQQYLAVYLQTSDATYDAVGNIIPGLIAIWFDRQGVVNTVAGLTIAIILVRLSLILLFGAELIL
jgi:poly-gamma-glutamate biosynthesis protein PgsC/CapC